MPQTDMEKAKRKAKLIGVMVRESALKHKKLDVLNKEGEKVASIGDKRYEDYNTHGDSKRRRLYKLRHEKHRHKVGTAAYYADRILW